MISIQLPVIRLPTPDMKPSTKKSITTGRHWAGAVLWLLLVLSFSANIFAADPDQKTTASKSRLVATNKAVLVFTKKVIGTTVGRGECWDLAQQALDYSGSIWKKPYQFGFPLKKGARILPGDIIQFHSLRLEWKKGNRSGWKQLGAPEHTSIVYAVNGSEIQLAHQNVNGVRKVFLDSINLNNIVSGSYEIFRPYKNSR